MTPKSVPTWLKTAHGLGSVAYGVKDNGFSVFLLIFYNQVLGINASLVGAAIMFALIFDAFIDPIIGELSDRTQSRWGRRLPWLYIAAIPAGLSWLALWHPPTDNTSTTIIWLFCAAVVTRAMIAACEVPSIALVPELSKDYHERTRLMRYRYLFAWTGGLVMLILAYGVFLTGPKGVTNPVGYNYFALTGAIVLTLSVLVSALAQHKVVAKQSPPLPPYQGVMHVLGDMRQTLSTPAFLWLIGAALFALINQGLTFAISNYVLVFMWRLAPSEMVIYAMVLFSTVIISFVIAAPLSERLGKKQAALLCAAITMFATAFLYSSWLFDFMPGAPDAPNRIFLFGIYMFTNSFAVTLMILTSSMLADVVEAAEEATGRRSEGLFYAGFFFTQKCAVGIGTFVAGTILTLAQFPADAKAGAIDIAILDRLGLMYMIVTLTFGAIGMLILRHFPISRADHEARVAATLAIAEKSN